MKRFIAIFMTLCLVLGLSGISVWADEANEWKIETKMPIARENFATCVIGDKIYVLGGRNTSSVDIYNTKTQTWEKGTPMPTASSTTKAVVIANKIYAICTLGSTDATTLMQVYDVSTNTWTEKLEPNVPKAYKGFGLVAIEQKMYVVNFNNNSKEPKTSISIYDTVSGEWTSSKAAGFTSRFDFAVCAGGTNIYVVGGQNSKLLEIYDTITDTWKNASPLPTSRSFATAVMVENNIYLIGGNNSNKVEIYNTETNSWTTGISLKQPRSSLESVAVDGKIYAIGGYTNTSVSFVESFQVRSSAAKLSVLLNVGETVQLSTSYNLDNNAKYTWSSTNEAVATVDSNGKVTAVTVGGADIYAQNADGTFKEYIPVKVVELADEQRLAVHLKAGEKAKLYLTDDTTQITWSSMDDSIASISTDGQITGVKKGLAIVQAVLDGQTYQIYVRVNG